VAAGAAAADPKRDAPRQAFQLVWQQGSVSGHDGNDRTAGPAKDLAAGQVLSDRHAGDGQLPPPAVVGLDEGAERVGAARDVDLA
jgi:hypothetical protein